MKKLFLLILFVTLIYLNYVESTNYCTGAIVCPGIRDGTNVLLNYNVDCKGPDQNGNGDGFCPENYNKQEWSDNNKCAPVNTGRCYPCDPDCGECSKITLIVSDGIEVCQS